MTEVETLLQKTSRTFALTIPHLPQPTRDEVAIAYLLFRLIDTFEDAVLWAPSRRMVELCLSPPPPDRGSGCSTKGKKSRCRSTCRSCPMLRS